MKSRTMATGEGGVVLEVSLNGYSLTALHKVAHRFTDRYYVHLNPVGEESPAQYLVRLQPKPSNAKDFGSLDVENLAGEFANELLDQTLREEVARESEPVRNLILAHALSSADFLHPELEAADPSDDPRDITRPDRSKNGHQ